MEMKQIKEICHKHTCEKCPLYDQDYWDCLIEMSPIEWDLDEIERRVENYGKKEN